MGVLLGASQLSGLLKSFWLLLLLVWFGFLVLPFGNNSGVFRSWQMCLCVVGRGDGTWGFPLYSTPGMSLSLG